MKIGELVAPITRPMAPTTKAASTTSENTPAAAHEAQGSSMAQEDRMLRRVALDQMFQEYQGLQNPTRKVEKTENKHKRRKRGRKWMKRVARQLRRHLLGLPVSIPLLRALRRARQACRRLAARLDRSQREEGPNRHRKRLRRALKALMLMLEPVEELMHLHRPETHEDGPTEEDAEADRVFTLAAASERGLDAREYDEAQTLWAEGQVVLKRGAIL